MNRDVAVDHLPGLPVDQDGPVFREPWEARAFALAVSLQEQGVFSRSEWAEHLGQAIKNAQAAGDQDLGDTYYEHWLACLESLLTTKRVTTAEILASKKHAAHEAHQRMHAELGHHHAHFD